jgi:hypothetical protein
MPAVAMKRTCRGRAAMPTTKPSPPLLWFAAMIAGPAGGMCSVPVTRSRYQKRKNGTRIARATAYSIGETPRSRAIR